MLATYMRCMRNNNWRLGLRAPLVARKKLREKKKQVFIYHTLSDEKPPQFL